MSRFLGIVSDIDGTLTYNDRSLSEKALCVARRLSGRIPIVLASGNTFCFTRTMSKVLATRSPLIAENGGILLPSFDADPIILTPRMDEILSAFSILKEQFDLTALDSRERVTDVSFLKTVEHSKLLPFLSAFENIDLVDAEYAYHLADKHIQKGAALQTTAKMMGLDAENFVAVGDSDNDVDLFRKSGFSFAVANASAAAKREADIVLKNGFGDGFAEAMEYLLKNDMLELRDEDARTDFYVI